MTSVSISEHEANTLEYNQDVIESSDAAETLVKVRVAINS